MASRCLCRCPALYLCPLELEYRFQFPCSLNAYWTPVSLYSCCRVCSSPLTTNHHHTTCFELFLGTLYFIFILSVNYSENVGKGVESFCNCWSRSIRQDAPNLSSPTNYYSRQFRIFSGLGNYWPRASRATALLGYVNSAVGRTLPFIPFLPTCYNIPR